MSKQTEALKLALEALENSEKLFGDPEDRLMTDFDLLQNAITAIHEALAEQPAPPPECKTDAEKTAFAFGWWKALEENRKQPAQQQEPVAWMNPSWADPDTRGWPSDSFESIPIDGWKPLYTSPPASKPWVGLSTSDLDEIDAPIRERGSATIAEIYRAIEAKLREKNA